MYNFLRGIIKRFLNVWLCNRSNCYRVVPRKNGVCKNCKCK